MSGWTLLASWGLVLGAAVAGTLAVLHAITVGRPRPAWLPTARFAPDRAPRAERRLATVSDRRLLALRALAALLAGLGLARPVHEPERRRVMRVVLADVSDGAARRAVRDSVQALVGAGDALVAFTAAPGPVLRVADRGASTTAGSGVRRAAIDSALSAAVPGGSDNAEAPASLSAALVVARRAAGALAADADSLELVVVSPFARDVVDAGTVAVRGAWAGRARLVRVAVVSAGPARAGAVVGASVALRGGPPDDALAAALALAGVARGDAAPVRVARGAVTEADRAWATGAGHALVVWPAGGVEDRGGRGAGGVGTPGAGAPGVQAVTASGRAVVGTFGRVALDAAAAPGTGPSRTLARWADGAPAAVERQTRDGCVRTVGMRVPQAGDAALRPTFLALLPALLGPCGAPRDRAPLAAADLARLAGVGPLLAAAPLRGPRSTPLRDSLGAALLASAAGLLAAELLLRRVWKAPAQADEGTEAVPDAAGAVGRASGAVAASRAEAA